MDKLKQLVKDIEEIETELSTFSFNSNLNYQLGKKYELLKQLIKEL